MAEVPKELLEVIACPIDKSNLKKSKDTLICTKCKRKYEIKENIPVLLPD